MILHVRNLARETTREDLHTVFHQFGRVIEITLFSGPGMAPGHAFVKMGSFEEANVAREGLADKDLRGRPLLIVKAPAFHGGCLTPACVGV